MIKDHPYADGCKRIAASLFLEFLARNNALYRDDNKIISDGALVAITLMIAESRPEEKRYNGESCNEFFDNVVSS